MNKIEKRLKKEGKDLQVSIHTSFYEKLGISKVILKIKVAEW